jgi:hypothetical protein
VRELCGGTLTIIDTTSDTVTSQFVEEDINRPTGKLTDFQAPFRRRPTAVSSSSASRSGSVAVVAMSRAPHGNGFRTAQARSESVHGFAVLIARRRPFFFQ